jgi:uncharacterized membrane protein
MNWSDTVTIDAPTALVWQLTTALADWPDLTPTMRSVDRLDDGPLRVGSRARVRQPGQRPAVWTVTRVEPEHEFRWQTVRPGLVLTGTHRLTAEGQGCRNTLVLEATGALAAPLGLLLGRLFRRALRTENAGFKAAAERRAATAQHDL